jgi:cell wall-associated NlpC family hydrolase
MSSALASPAVARGGLTLVVSSGLVAGGALSAGATAPSASAKASTKASSSSAAHRAHLAHLAHLAHKAHLARHRGAAAPARSRTSASRSAPRSSISGRAGVIAVASRYLGVPYRYGGSSPRGFDCSGFVQYVYSRLGIRLPRTAQQQYNATRHIPRSQARPGDLVFFFVGGRVTHVGIFAGGNTMIAAPHSGQVVHRQRIYSANVAFGRV